MAIKSVKLFGVEQKDKACVLISHGDVGFWFITQGERSVGEAEYLKSITSKLEAVDTSNNWLIIRIIQDNKDRLIEEYRTKNPDNLKPERLLLALDENNPRELTLTLETYVRTLIQNTDILHWAIYPHAQKILESVSSELLFQQQIEYIKAAFKYRYINDPDKVIVSEEDPQLGKLPLKSFLHDHVVGADANEDLDKAIAEIPERLAAKIFIFMRDDFRGQPYTTDLQLKKTEEAVKVEEEETNNNKVEPTTIDESEQEEKKPALNKSVRTKIEAS
jgi:hypothetical protein